MICIGGDHVSVSMVGVSLWKLGSYVRYLLIHSNGAHYEKLVQVKHNQHNFPEQPSVSFKFPVPNPYPIPQIVKYSSSNSNSANLF